MAKEFVFNLGDEVQLKRSGEQGEIVGRAQYTASENNYLVRYAGGDGCQKQCWWEESALR